MILNRSVRRGALALLIGSIGTMTLSKENALAITIAPTTVNATDYLTGTTDAGSFTLDRDYAASDVLNLTVSGTINIDSFVDNGYVTNAAGVTTQPGTPFFGNPPTGAAVAYDSSRKYGSLLFGNSVNGYRQVFQANAANGLGSDNPPTTLSISTTLGAVFENLSLSRGTVLGFRITDVNSGDNTGSFLVSGSIGEPATAVPEPFTILGSIAALGTGAAIKRKQSKQASKA